MGVGLQYINHAPLVGGKEVDDALGVAIPQKHVAAVTSAYDVLAVGTVVVDALYCINAKKSIIDALYCKIQLADHRTVVVDTLCCVMGIKGIIDALYCINEI